MAAPVGMPTFLAECLQSAYDEMLARLAPIKSQRGLGP